MKNYYKVLEVEPTATAEKIKAQYRFLVLAWHPDKFPSLELRAKAEEKMIEINEAYSILGNPTKRVIFDNQFFAKDPKAEDFSKPQSYSRSGEAHSQSPYNSQSFDPHPNSLDYCQSCGQRAETKYVVFHENIGMFVMRRHRAARGKICKNCVNYYFWNLTGKTMLVGWWGVISSFVTPFILLNNLFRYVLTIGMKKPAINLSPSPSWFWVFTTISGYLLILFFIISMITPTTSSPITITATSPAATSVVLNAPTLVVMKTNTPKPYKPQPTPISTCYSWDQVTKALVGRKICVTGIVFNKYSTADIATKLTFSPSSNKFYIIDNDYYYPDLKIGDCVIAEAYIQILWNGVPYMSVDQLFRCD